MTCAAACAFKLRIAVLGIGMFNMFNVGTTDAQTPPPTVDVPPVLTDAGCTCLPFSLSGSKVMGTGCIPNADGTACGWCDVLNDCDGAREQDTASSYAGWDSCTISGADVCTRNGAGVPACVARCRVLLSGSITVV